MTVKVEVAVVRIGEPAPLLSTADKVVSPARNGLMLPTVTWPLTKLKFPGSVSYGSFVVTDTGLRPVETRLEN